MTQSKTWTSSQDLLLENGQRISDLQLAYHTFGKLNSEKSNVIWVFHALSGSSNVMNWWPGLFGDNCLYNPVDHFIICVNSIGSPYGSSHPGNREFPHFSMRDVVSAHQLLASALDITSIHTAIGGSFGGNQALEFAYSFSGQIDHLVLIASSARESAWGIAIHESQRLALETDPSFGLPNGGQDGMRAARSMAMLNYRTSDSFITHQTDSEEKVDDFNASSYVRYQGEKFVGRFNALCYHYLTKCLDSHNIGRGRGGEARALACIDIPTLLIGIDSDTLVPPRFQKFMAEHIPHSSYQEITSDYGHDGFLVEYAAISEKITAFHNQLEHEKNECRRTVMKFGGSSLVNEQLPAILQIVKQAVEDNPIALVVSARGNTTDQLLALFEKYLAGQDADPQLAELINCQKVGDIDLSETHGALKSLFHLVRDIKLQDEIIKDRVLAFGEQLSAKVLAKYLSDQGLKCQVIDSGDMLHLDEENGELNVDLFSSEQATKEVFNSLSPQTIPVITGYYGRDHKGRIRTLGRNGTNYSATLIAKFIRAREVHNWTNVDGIYSADPRFVEGAQSIAHMSYREANELANFGASVLHSKTILPLMKSDIPLRILSTESPERPGTLIDRNGSGKGVKAVSVIKDVSLIKIEGKGLSGRVGIDGRIFSVLSRKSISVRIISQASSERGIGFIIDKKDALLAEQLLLTEFEIEVLSGDISNITIEHDMAIIAIVGRHNYALEKAIHGLRKNKIWMHLISNSISGEHISLVVDARQAKKAARVVHGQVMGATNIIHVFAIGKGTVGGRFVDQILETQEALEFDRRLQVRVIGVADSQRYIFNEKGIDADWKKTLHDSPKSNRLPEILKELRASQLENIVIADNSSSLEIAEAYPEIIGQGFDIVASNKKANSISQDSYSELRSLLKRKGRSFLYETNVGAGLPLIDTLKNLLRSADKVERIRGVFSGSLSYLFNTFCAEERSFSDILLEAKKNGLTEPDPREDLSGLDVARKLLILAREVGLSVEFEEVEIQGLVPDRLYNTGDFDDFMKNRTALDRHYSEVMSDLNEGEVLRYVGDLDVSNGLLKVALERVKITSPLGGLKEADSLFEIYTTSYGDHPMVIQGAGAGAEVTARGVYSDVIKIGMLI